MSTLKFLKIKMQLAETAKKLSDQTEKSLKAGKIPADYSLGFANGIIFADHKISERRGNPKFFDRTGSIGILPKPIALVPGSKMGFVSIFYNLQSNIVLQAKNTIDEIIFDEKRNSVEFTDKAINAIAELRERVNLLASFLLEQEEIENAPSSNEETKEGKPNDDAKASSLQAVPNPDHNDGQPDERVCDKKGDEKNGREGQVNGSP